MDTVRISCLCPYPTPVQNSLTGQATSVGPLQFFLTHIVACRLTRYDCMNGFCGLLFRTTHDIEGLEVDGCLGEDDSTRMVHQGQHLAPCRHGAIGGRRIKT